MPASNKWGNFALLVFKLNGGGSIEQPEHWARDIPEPAIEMAEAAIDHGMELYHEVCTFCHGIALSASSAVPICAK